MNYNKVIKQDGTPLTYTDLAMGNYTTFEELVEEHQVISLTNDEVVTILKNGSTNQRNFIKSIQEADNNPSEVIQAIKEFDIECDTQTKLRDWLNGGVMTFEEITEEIKNNYCYIPCDNGYGVVYY